MNDKKYISITDFTKLLKNNLENSYPYIFLKGEISNYRPASSGHWYFSLKDNNASINAIIFKNYQSQILNNFKSIEFQGLKDGLEVLVEGRISVYERSGSYSIIINKLLPVKIGDLSIKFEMLKQKLLKEGLFNNELKKELPKFPSHIGIVTSPTAAALQDILNVLSRRFSQIKITVFPASVQGENAKYDISKAIKFADYHYKSNTRYKVDTLIIARGGGSIEDLWPFNEEIVAYAIYNAQIPIITGIGHEIDYTIADFCADYRAPTPSAAAEIVVKNSEELLNSISAFKLRMQGAMDNKMNNFNFRYNNVNKSILLRKFKRIYENNLQDFDFLEDKLKNVFHNYYKNIKQNYLLLMQKLNDLSPLKTLSRGYSVVFNKNNKIIKSTEQVKLDEELSVLLEKGKLSVKVIEKKSQ